MSIAKSECPRKEETNDQQPVLMTVESSDSYLPHQHKIAYMQIRRQVFLLSSGEDCHLRMVLFATLFKSMSTNQTPDKNVFDTLCKLLVVTPNGLSNQSKVAQPG